MIERIGLSQEDIAQRAYDLYVERGRESGKDVEDWVKAEKELTVERAWRCTPRETFGELASWWAQAHHPRLAVPASANPFWRRMQESHCPQGSPEVPGS